MRATRAPTHPRRTHAGYRPTGDAENDRARARGERHPPQPPLELTSWEDIRALLPVDPPRLAAAYQRQSDAESMLCKGWEAQHGSNDINADPVGMLLSYPIAPENGDDSLWPMGLWEKVAALGGHLEVHAIFPDEQVTPITEPGSEGQPPLIERDMDRAAPPTPADREPLPDGQVAVELTHDERAFLISGLVEWTRVAPPTASQLQTLGFTSLQEFTDEQLRLAYALRYAEAMAPRTGNARSPPPRSALPATTSALTAAGRDSPAETTMSRYSSCADCSESLPL